jgi:uncharacterized repeat protein (TIGR02543 family)
MRIKGIRVRGIAVSAFAVCLCFAFAVSAYAGVVAFPTRPIMTGGGSGGAGEVSPNGFSLSGDQAGKPLVGDWLPSLYSNAGWMAVYGGGNTYGTQSVVDSGSQTLYAYVDKNPSSVANGAFIFANQDEIRVPASAFTFEVPFAYRIIGDNSDGWRIPFTLDLAPGSTYAFGFLRGLTANNGVTCVIDAGATGYLQNPADSELAWYEARKNDVYQYREHAETYDSFITTPTVNTVATNAAGTMRDFLFTIEVQGVRFDSNGGSLVSPQAVAEGSSAVMPATPVRTGHDFNGWFADPECAVPWDFEAMTVDAGATVIYAGWTAQGTVNPPDPKPDPTPDPKDQLPSGSPKTSDSTDLFMVMILICAGTTFVLAYVVYKKGETLI